MSISVPVRGEGQCEVPSCRQYDFLPCKCDLCGGIFCADHKSYSDHRCKQFVDRTLPNCPICGQAVLLQAGVDPDTAVMRHIDKGCPKESRAAPTKERHNYCSFPTCTTNEHVTILCRECGDQFCISHRNEDAHNCRKGRSPHQMKKAAASTSPSPSPSASPSSGRQRDDKLFSLGFPNLSFGNTRDNPVKLQKSHNSTECLSLVFFFPASAKIKPRHFLVHKSWIAGRVLDSVCREVGYSNPNNKATSGEKLQVYNLRSFEHLSPNSRMECVVNDGDPMLIGPFHPLPDEIMAEAMHYVWPLERSTTAASVWSCAACTLENPGAALSCTLCGQKR